MTDQFKQILFLPQFIPINLQLLKIGQRQQFGHLQIGIATAPDNNSPNSAFNLIFHHLNAIINIIGNVNLLIISTLRGLNLNIWVYNYLPLSRVKDKIRLVFYAGY